MNSDPQVEVVTSGGVSPDDAEHAGTAIRDVLAGTPASVKVTLSVVADPALPRPSLAQATVEHGRRRLRVQAAAASPREAIELLRGRLALRAATSSSG